MQPPGVQFDRQQQIERDLVDQGGRDARAGRRRRPRACERRRRFSRPRRRRIPKSAAIRPSWSAAARRRSKRDVRGRDGWRRRRARQPAAGAVHVGCDHARDVGSSTRRTPAAGRTRLLRPRRDADDARDGQSGCAGQHDAAGTATNAANGTDPPNPSTPSNPAAVALCRSTRHGIVAVVGNHELRSRQGDPAHRQPARAARAALSGGHPRRRARDDEGRRRRGQTTTKAWEPAGHPAHPGPRRRRGRARQRARRSTHGREHLVRSAGRDARAAGARVQRSGDADSCKTHWPSALRGVGDPAASRASRSSASCGRSRGARPRWPRRRRCPRPPRRRGCRPCRKWKAQIESELEPKGQATGACPC